MQMVASAPPPPICLQGAGEGECRSIRGCEGEGEGEGQGGALRLEGGG